MTAPAHMYGYAADDSEIKEASQIPAAVHAEVRPLATALFDRFLTLLESLTPEEWQAPTYCTEWTVRDIVAHEAGGYESGTSFGAFRRTWLRLPERGRELVDTINAAQIRARAGRSPEELIAELRDVGPRAIAARGRLSTLVRTIPIPIPPMGICRTGYLTDQIYLRDAWIHTIDISHATDRPLRLNADVDGRIVALLVARSCATAVATTFWQVHCLRHQWPGWGRLPYWAIRVAIGHHPHGRGGLRFAHFRTNHRG